MTCDVSVPAFCCINQWKTGAQADLGMGNSPGETDDWTFTRNAGSHRVKRLRVLVRTEMGAVR